MAVKIIAAKPVLRRYIDLAVACHILQSRSLTLIDPERWDDGNDRFGIAEYKDRRHLKSLLAMCFADCPETYHHWKVFAPGMSGVCLEFYKEPLINKFATIPGLSYRGVEYRKVYLQRRAKWEVADLPFIKRAPYEPEREFRVIYESAENELDHFNVEVDFSWIHRVILSPWLPKAMKLSITAVLRAIPGCSHLTVQGTALIDSDTWKSHVRHASEPPVGNK